MKKVSKSGRVTIPGRGTRKLSSWVESFCDYMNVVPSPTIFKKWAGISMLVGALERKVWVRTFGSNLYPHLYIILVAPPGVGKTMLTSKVRVAWACLEEHHISPSSVTGASIIDALYESKRRIIPRGGNGVVEEFNSMFIAANELGVLLPIYEGSLINKLTDIYDNHSYQEQRRTGNIKIEMDRPQINMLSATTPGYLMGSIPETAWDQGFMSRTIMIYSGESLRKSLFDEPVHNTELWDDLMHDLQIIGEYYGKMKFEKDAAEAIDNWQLAGGPPRPDHPRLLHYNTRRPAHLLKLCMAASVSRGNDLLITLEDYQTALDWLMEAETFMPDVFKAMAGGGDARAIEDTLHFVYQIYAREKQPVEEHRVVRFVQERVPSHSVMRVIEVMVKANLLKEAWNKTGGKTFCPTPRQPGA